MVLEGKDVGVDLVAKALIDSLLDVVFQSNILDEVTDEVATEVVEILYGEVLIALDFNLDNRASKLRLNSFNRIKSNITYFDTEDYPTESVELANELLPGIRDVIETLGEEPLVLLASKILEFKVNGAIEPEDLIRMTVLTSVYTRSDTSEINEVLGNLVNLDTERLVDEMSAMVSVDSEFVSNMGLDELYYYPNLLVTLVSMEQGLDWFKNTLTYSEAVYFLKLKLRVYRYMLLIKENHISAKSKADLLRVAIEATDSECHSPDYKETKVYKQLNKFYLGGAV